MDVVSSCFVFGVKRMTMNEQSTFFGQGGGRGETFRFSLLLQINYYCVSFHFSFVQYTVPPIAVYYFSPHKLFLCKEREEKSRLECSKACLRPRGGFRERRRRPRWRVEAVLEDS